MSAPIRVLNAAGEYEPYSEEKVRNSLGRAGADGFFQDKIIEHLMSKLYDGIPTKVVYKEITHLLKKLKSPTASRYHLKEAIMQLGPTGFPFEKYFAGLLESNGYQTVTNDFVKGKCVFHEIDIVAQKGEEKIMIECKFHHEPGVRSDVKDGLYSYARFLDIKEQGFTQAWLVTNTKATSEVIAYGQCAGLKVISWNYPDDFSLRELVGRNKQYPITVLDSLPLSSKQTLLANGIVFCKDLFDNNKTACIPTEILEKAKKGAEQLI